MSARFARNSAAADTHSPPARVFEEASPRSKQRFWRKFVESLSANPDGVLLVDKAEGMTSHDVVALTRRKLATKKIGHCGTLDPIATGLLLLTIGRGTKVQDLLMSEDKEYAGTFVLGVTTDTQDRQGEVIQQRPVPALGEDQIRAAFEKFRGDFYQLPPMVSAKKHAGVPLYKLARQGKVVEREPRLVHVYRYTIDRITLPEIDFSVLCSKGFYVRTYVHDIGEILGCGAHLKSLRRTKSGRFDVANAVTVDQIKNATREEILNRMLSLPEVSRMRGA
ncbi:MAG: tRNA pseudouridine(55) synthase TruB [Verrucomicrobia bacterium]|nr:MAG: tRNA pseudouridine(55) synthase TruB [Verrucomicrobiota bacterium]PYK25247.1 MAG: tRNA pseudouridine(55) synthase TruB [Verrucomicrobiota bacterium]PYK52451.1 MAG: tRNA pseudouridine(55) synthase TruB [Verrucomicrobiota bacterium]